MNRFTPLVSGGGFRCCLVAILGKAVWTGASAYGFCRWTIAKYGVARKMGVRWRDQTWWVFFVGDWWWFLQSLLLNFFDLVNLAVLYYLYCLCLCCVILWFVYAP